MPTLFISYKRGTTAIAPIMDVLRAAKYRLWFDRDEIHLGDPDWQARIDRGLERQPVNPHDALKIAAGLLPDLLANDGVRDTQLLIGEELAHYLDDLRNMDENALQALLQQARDDAQTYHTEFIAKQTKK